MRKFAIMLGLLSALALPTACLADPIISGVTFSGSPANPTITITGSGFGTAPMGMNAPYGTGQDYGTSLYIFDNTSNFDAGFQGMDIDRSETDWVGLVLSSYSDTSITYQYGSYYTPGGFSLNPNDSYTVGVAGVDYSGNVAYTPEPSSLILMGTGLAGIAGIVRRRLLPAVSCEA